MKPTFFLVAFVALLVSCKQEFVKDPKPLPKVKTAKVVTLQTENSPLPVYTSGRVQVLENARLSFKTGGLIRRMLVDDGDAFQKGDVLAELDLKEINSRVVQAKAQVEKLTRDVARFQRLLQDSAATLQNLQDLETALEVAKADLAIAQFNRTYSTIVAASDGKVLQRMAEPGELASPGQPILYTSSTSSGMGLTVGLSDRDVVKVQLGDSASVVLDAYPDLPAQAVVIEIGEEAHPRIGTYTVKLALQEYPRPIRNGFFAKARIFPSLQSPYYRIPIQAVIEASKGSVSIFQPEDNRAVKTTVKPVYYGDDYVAVQSSALRAAMLLTDGAAYLRDGETFEVNNPKP